MSQVSAGSIVEIEFLFYNSEGLVSPDDLVGEIFAYNASTKEFSSTPEDTFNPTALGIGVYSYEWTAVGGIHKIVATGQFDSDNDIVIERYYSVGSGNLESSLEDSIVITMLGELSPLYLDAYEIIDSYYPDGDPVEITEIIWSKSVELENKLGKTDLLTLTSIQYDWIVAATMCELSRRYGLVNGGLGGFQSAESFQLGDLQVDRGSSSSFASGKYDAGNASNWCEMAAALKDMISSSGETYKPVVPGARFPSTVPSRRIKCS